MAKTEKLENQALENEVVEEKEVVEIKYPLKREEYYDKVNKKSMFSFFIQEQVALNGTLKTIKVKVTCNKKDIDMFETINMLFDLGCNPVLVRKAYSMELADGTINEGYQYFVRAVINGVESDLQVALMKSSDKFLADFLFNVK